jgi:hypothetical protein
LKKWQQRLGPQAPLIGSPIAGWASQRLEVLSGDVAVGWPILTAPDVPADRVQALRKTFDDTVADPQFIAAARQANVDVNPMRGEELQKIVAGILGRRRRS